MGARDIIYKIEHAFPEIDRPKRHVPLKEKFAWTVVALLLYFAMAEIPLFGIPETVQDYFQTLRVVLAGRNGSLLTLGIGPIVTAGIIMQLLVGSEIIRLDLSNPEDRRFYQARRASPPAWRIFSSALGENALALITRGLVNFPLPRTLSAN